MYPRYPNLCPEAVVDCVGKSWIFIQCSCLIAPLNGYESALILWRTCMLLPNAGRKLTDWFLRGFIQCANIQVLMITWSITASVHKFGAVGMTMMVRRVTKLEWCALSFQELSRVVGASAARHIRMFFENRKSWKWISYSLHFHVTTVTVPHAAGPGSCWRRHSWACLKFVKLLKFTGIVYWIQRLVEFLFCHCWCVILWIWL